MNKLSKKLLYLLICSVILLSACQRDKSLFESIDIFLFHTYGGTVFEKPAKVSLKDIHLDDGRLQGKRLVVEGSIVTVGEYDSYVIIQDSSARMLVLLNKIIDADRILAKTKEAKTEQDLRVLGTVFKGKKGLPYISAESLNLPKVSKKKGSST